tara:strand:- start:29 stop:397 length:369 start_codon:yes stop_codon:yes gene_type:complete
MKRIVTLLACLFILSPNLAMSETKVSLVCQWTIYDQMNESFLIDLAIKTVIWVDEETELKIEKFTDGYIKFQGKKSLLQTSKGWLKDVPVSFKIDRISGRFYVVSDFVKTDRIGICEKMILF